MKAGIPALAAVFAMACAPSKAPERLVDVGHEHGIHATGVIIDVPWDREHVRVQADEARLFEQSDVLELAGDVRFEWPGRFSGRADRAVIDIREKNLSLEDGVRARFAIDSDSQEATTR